MFEDARTVEDGAVLACDIAVVGAGAAGIAIAREFVDSPLRLCLLEGGGLEIDAATQELYHGHNAGLPYFDLALSRLRWFGGTTNHWAGYVVPFDAYSFKERAWIADSGWPIGPQDLAPYYQRANRLLGLAEHSWDVAVWEERRAEARLPADHRRLVSDLFLINPVRMGEIFADELRSSQQVTTYLNANVTAIETAAGDRRVDALQVRTLAGKGFRILPRSVVLSAGAIENARLLLAADAAGAPGPGNRHDLVGRYFADHPYFAAGVIQPAHPGVDVGFYQRRAIGSLGVKGRLKLPEAVLREEQLVPVAIALLAVSDKAADTAGARSLKALLRSARHGELPSRLGTHIGNVLSDLGSLTGVAARTAWHGQVPIAEIVCQVGFAPAPNPESRVLLGDSVDALGMRQVVLDWRLSEIDKRSARRALEILAEECGRIGLGRMQIQLDGDDSSWPDNLEGSYHHMGTTRMADDPRKGVVDRDCRVHDTRNLYVAGSSVFPTYGLGSPTQMLIALALRLADHLKQRH